MFTKTKKILFGFLAFFAVLLIAGCQSSPSQSSKTNKSSANKSPQTIKAPQDLTKDQLRTWKWTDQQMTIQKVILATISKKTCRCTNA